MKKSFEVPKDRPEITFKLTRDSVAAGDDIDAPHERKQKTYSFTDPAQLIRELSSGYLPSVAGIGHTWDCLVNGICIGVISQEGIKPSVHQVEYSDTNHVHFRYHSATY